ncbi:MAG: hypothetical protein RTU63_00920, partial [Candidatus Thorarchaeota archaeon]
MSGNEELEKAVLEMDIETSVKTIKHLVEKDGWKAVLTEILENLDRYLSSAWYGRNWFLLSLMDSVELVGLDYDVEEILKTIDDLHDFSKVQDDAIEKLIEKVRKQLQEGYPTYFYNLELMEKKRTIVLVGDLIKARQIEFINSNVNENHWNFESYIGLAHCIEKGIVNSHDEGEGDCISIDSECASEIFKQIANELDIEQVRKSSSIKEDSRFRGFFNPLHYIIEIYWRKEPGGDAEDFKQHAYSGLVDSVKIVQMTDNYKGIEGWRGIPEGLLPIFTNFNKFTLLPACMMYLIELDHPIVPEVLGKVLQALSYRTNTNEQFEGDISKIIEIMTDNQIEENIDALVDYIGNSEMDLEGWYFPVDFTAASKALEKKAHLLNDEHHRKISSISRWFTSDWQEASHVCQMNAVILRTSGPNAIQYAKDVMLCWYWWNDERVFMIDDLLLEFLKSKNIDVIPILVESALEILKDEYFSHNSLEVVDTLTEFDPAILPKLQNEFLSQSFTEYIQEEGSIERIGEKLGVFVVFTILGGVLLDHLKTGVAPSHNTEPQNLEDYENLEKYYGDDVA